MAQAGKVLGVADLPDVNNIDLQRLVTEIQQSRRSEAGQAAPAAKRQRVDGSGEGVMLPACSAATETDFASVLGAAAPRLASAPAASAQRLPVLGLSLPPCPPLSTGQVASGGTFLGLPADVVAAAQFTPNAATMLQAVTQQGLLSAAVALAAGGNGDSHAAAAAAGAGATRHYSASGGTHSQGQTNSAEGGSGGPHVEAAGIGGRVIAGHGGAVPRGKRSSEGRLTASKEKNRRAQQRFRLRQKEKMHFLESELQRLRELCMRHNIDPFPNTLPPAAAGGGAVTELQQLAAGPSAEQMYDELELMLDRCPAIPTHTVIAYLTAFQKADLETRRCQYRSLKRRYESAKLADLATCILCFMGSGACAGGGAGA